MAGEPFPTWMTATRMSLLAVPAGSVVTMDVPIPLPEEAARKAALASSTLGEKSTAAASATEAVLARSRSAKALTHSTLQPRERIGIPVAYEKSHESLAYAIQTRRMIS